MVFGQNEEFLQADSLAIIQLKFNTLDSNGIKAMKPVKCPIKSIVFFGSQDGINIGYYTSDSNKWTTFLSPFTRFPFEVDTINLDRKGYYEIVTRGDIAEYGSGGGTNISSMVIINIDSIPTQLFEVNYGIMLESFGRNI